MGRGTLGEVQDGSGDPRGGPERIGGLSGTFGTGQEASEKSGTSHRTLREVRDG